MPVDVGQLWNDVVMSTAARAGGLAGPRFGIVHRRGFDRTPSSRHDLSSRTPSGEAWKRRTQGRKSASDVSSSWASELSVHASDHRGSCDLAHGRRRDGSITHIERRQGRAFVTNDLFSAIRPRLWLRRQRMTSRRWRLLRLLTLPGFPVVSYFRRPS